MPYSHTILRASNFFSAMLLASAAWGQQPNLGQPESLPPHRDLTLPQPMRQPYYPGPPPSRPAVSIGGPFGVIIGAGNGVRIGGPDGVQFGGGAGARFGGHNGVQFGGGAGVKIGPPVVYGHGPYPTKRAGNPMRPGIVTLKYPETEKHKLRIHANGSSVEMNPGETLAFDSHQKPVVVRVPKRNGRLGRRDTLTSGHYVIHREAQGWTLIPIEPKPMVESPLEEVPHPQSSLNLNSPVIDGRDAEHQPDSLDRSVLKRTP